MESIVTRIKASPPPSPPSSPGWPGSPTQGVDVVRRSMRLEARRRTSLGPFRILPCEVLQHMLSFAPARSLCQLALVSTGWRAFLRDWLSLRSTGWILAPARRYPYGSEDFYDEYTDLGILCRRVMSEQPMAERAHDFWGVLHRIEAFSLCRDPGRYEPTFMGASNFFRAAVALNCCRSQGERFEVMWQVVKDVISVDRSVLEGPAGRAADDEVDLRLAMRLLFLVPTAAPRRALLACRATRGALLRALVAGLSHAHQARLLYILYGPRSGNTIDWTRPCDSTYIPLVRMLHTVAELGSAIQEIGRSASHTAIYTLVRHVTRTPSAWLPRFQVMLLLTMGARAAGAVFAGYACRVPPVQPLYIPRKIAQMLCLSELYKIKLDLGTTTATGPILTAVSLNIFDLITYFYRFVPTMRRPEQLVPNISIEACSLAFNVGDKRLLLKIQESMDQFLKHFRGMP